ncbi:MAG: hypothetical protein RLY14_2576, partial [Planctomycetota bacterium]
MNGSRPPRSRYNRPLGDRMSGDRNSGDRQSDRPNPPLRRPSDSSRYHEQANNSPLEQRIRELD